MLSTILRRFATVTELPDSKLLNEDTFYPVFLKDLSNCHSEVLIESPFITNRRLNQLLPALQKLKDRRVRVAINTKDPKEHEDEYRREDAISAISALQRLGIHVIYTCGHHRKLAILDRKILYEGSLNVLSQNGSREVMRRVESVQWAWQMVAFVGLDKYLT